MKYLLLISFFMFFAGLSYGQKNNPANDSTIYIREVVATAPVFKGGIARFNKLFYNKFKHGDKPATDQIRQEATIVFVVEKDGHITGLRLNAANVISPQIEKDALQAFKECKGWKAATIYKKNVRAQQRISIHFNVPKKEKAPSADEDENVLFIPVEIVVAAPKMGYPAFYNYLENKRDKSIKASGWVFVSFIVERNGGLSAIKIAKGLSPQADAEALRLITTSTEWTPSIQFGRPLRVMCTVPVNFE